MRVPHSRSSAGAALLLGATLALPPSASAAWSTNPAQNNVVVSADGYQNRVVAVPDGAGGALLVWADGRSANPGLYAQRLGVAGDRLWAASGVLVGATGPATLFEVVARALPGGGVDVAWVGPNTTGPGSEIRIQRLSGGGVPLWGDAGRRVTGGLNDRGSLSLVDDAAGGAIIVWADSRNGLDDSDVYAQRYSAGGVAQWAAGGTLVSVAPTSGGYQGYARARADGAGGVFVVYVQRDLLPRGLLAQRLDAAGNRLWGDGRFVCCASPQAGPSVELAPDGPATAITYIAFEGGAYRLRAQRVDAEASPQWGPDGAPILDVPAFAVVRPFPDGAGGLLVQAAEIATGAPVYAQRLLADGSRAWGPNGVVVAGAAGSFPRTGAAPDGASGLVVVYPADGPGGDVDLRAQRLSPSGALLWGASGVPLATAADRQSLPSAVVSPPGGVIVAWSDRRSVADDDIYASRLNPDGSLPVELLTFAIE